MNQFTRAYMRNQVSLTRASGSVLIKDDESFVRYGEVYAHVDYYEIIECYKHFICTWAII